MMGSAGDDGLSWGWWAQLRMMGSAGDDGLSWGWWVQPGNLWCLDCCMLRLLNSEGEITLLGNKPCWGDEFPLGRNSIGFNLVKIGLAGDYGLSWGWWAHLDNDGLCLEKKNLSWRRYTQLGKMGSAGQFRLTREYILSWERYTQLGKIYSARRSVVSWLLYIEKFALGWGNNSVGEINPVEEMNFL